MELNVECVRAILLYLEERTNVYLDMEDRRYKVDEISTAQMTADPILANDYTPDEIVYTILQLYRGEMLILSDAPAPGEAFHHLHVTDLTWSGHEFVASIKNQTVWNAVTKTAKAFGATSVKGLFALSRTVVSVLISNPEAIQQLQTIVRSFFLHG